MKPRQHIEKRFTGNDDSENGKRPGFHLCKEPVVRGRAGEDVPKDDATMGKPPADLSELPAYEDLGSLPYRYGSKSLFLIARDPRWLFSYWDIDWDAYPSSRMQGGKVILRVFNSDNAEIYSANINADARNWYIPVTGGHTNFYAEIGFVNQAGAWEVIARSEGATTPSDGISEEVSDCFATIPYNLSFQQVFDIMKTSMREGESLLSALSRIQTEGRNLVFLLGTAPNWTDEQRRLLAVLLGNDLADIVGLGSAEIDQLLRKQLKERLSSESASGWLGYGAPGESSLFSGFAAFGSWTELSSWAAAGSTSFWSSWLSSWSGRGETLSSWLASWGGAAETSFWSGLLSSWSGAKERAALSSWLASWGGPAETAALSSWLASWSGVKEVSFWSSYLSSWKAAQVSLSSWLSSWGEIKQNAFWSSFLSSWPAAAGASETSAFWSLGLSSWSGAVAPSSASGSGELGASWSAQPFGVPREFFVNVNAEVIFHGDTHPDAKVWVDGKPIALNPDGTFRFHFKFLDGNCSIPIVAESPDRRERRSTTLRFERGTVR